MRRGQLRSALRQPEPPRSLPLARARRRVRARCPRVGVLFHPAAAPTAAELEAIVERTARRAVAWLRRHGYLDERPLEERSNEPPAQTALDACAAIAMGRGKVSTLPRDGTQDDGARGPRQSAPTSPRSPSNAMGSTCMRACASKPATISGASGSARYGARPPLSLERLRRLPGGRVAYRLKYVEPRRRGKHRVMTGDGVHGQARGDHCAPTVSAGEIRGGARAAQRRGGARSCPSRASDATACAAARTREACVRPNAAAEQRRRRREGARCGHAPRRAVAARREQHSPRGPPCGERCRDGRCGARGAPSARRHRARAERDLGAALGSAARRRALRGLAQGGLGDALLRRSSPWTSWSARSATVGFGCSPSSPSASPCAASSRTSGCRPMRRRSPARATRPTSWTGRGAGAARPRPRVAWRPRPAPQSGPRGGGAPRCALKLIN